DEFTENFGIATASILPKWFVQNLSGVQILSTFYTLGKAKIGTKLNAVLDASPIGRFERRQNSDARIFSPTERLYKGADALAKSLESLLRVTYGFGPNDDIGELKYRMKYLGNMMVGNNPMIKETIAGFGRTDAFGRIGNLVLRGNNPVNLTGEVSYPWLWGIKYRSMIHYNGNTNSVVLRNVGQSLGLGAVIFPDGSASSNVYNLDRLEHLVHKIKFPQWEETFKGISELQIKRDLLPRGKEIYTAKCAHCHESDKFVGPVQDGYEHGRLRDLKVSVFKTDLSDSDYVRKNGFDQRDFDPTVAMNATEPVIVNGEKVPFERMILAGVAGIKEKFYQKYQFTQEQKDSFEFRDIRGYEFFRDTKNGFERQNEFGNNYGNIRKNSGYIAKPLAGIWATAPFLHNGSVPTLMDLLKPVEQRPKFFNVKIREFDPVNIGYKGAHRDSPCRSDEEATCFDVSKVGNANTGHAGKIYGTENDITDEDRKALIEYLKVLPPYIEYSWKYNSSEEAGGNW
ncbi:MAG: di-heme-cytochrome C peroxidase, partial [Bdellovibrio sp.]